MKYFCNEVSEDENVSTIEEENEDLMNDEDEEDDDEDVGDLMCDGDKMACP